MKKQLFTSETQFVNEQKEIRKKNVGDKKSLADSFVATATTLTSIAYTKPKVD